MNMNTPLPKTVDEAVDQIIALMAFDAVVKISKLSEMELSPIKLALRIYVQNRLGEALHIIRSIGKFFLKESFHFLFRKSENIIQERSADGFKR